ncbi:hypothetical protein JCM17846_27920 [Iodidimonas nitroreducens]|uniref:YnbE-like lipoprotein n=1 Tax=Iodidimonas nitroreducens TaxID=1236968 RepID=A0A5A7NCB2_9PROT|nr:YnbE family lipoprotein [Iodidimonas nitroreducens]GAK34426.1 hypothetical protein AQ1_02325 [alpha proteobacterium Q-1]GER05110.1 hypothetical protein JCM17846_27920 [Iodidimonas nitroreducens]
MNEMRHKGGRLGARLGLMLGFGLLAAGCSPTVKLQAPSEPIRFDVNINITEQKRLEIDQELLDLIRRNPALFGLSADDLDRAVPKAPDSLPQGSNK